MVFFSFFLFFFFFLSFFPKMHKNTPPLCEASSPWTQTSDTHGFRNTLPWMTWTLCSDRFSLISPGGEKNPVKTKNNWGNDSSIQFTTVNIRKLSPFSFTFLDCPWCKNGSFTHLSSKNRTLTINKSQSQSLRECGLFSPTTSHSELTHD